MEPLTLFLIGGILYPSILTIYGLVRLPKWKERGFDKYDFKWTPIFISSFIASFLGGLAVFSFSDNPWISIAFTPLVYMLVLGSITDLRIAKIPMGISILAYLLPLPIMIASLNNSFIWLSVIVWTVLILLFLFFVYVDMFGMADLRIMILAGTSLVWWVGVDNMLLAFGLSAFVQLLAYPIAHKFNLGVMKPRKSFGYEIKEKERLEKERLAKEQAEKDGVEYVPVVEEVVEPKKQSNSVIARFFRWLNKKMDHLVNGKSETEKRFLPFGPALYFTFTLLGIVFSAYFAVYEGPSFL